MQLVRNHGMTRVSAIRIKMDQETKLRWRKQLDTQAEEDHPNPLIKAEIEALNVTPTD